MQTNANLEGVARAQAALHDECRYCVESQRDTAAFPEICARIHRAGLAPTSLFCLAVDDRVLQTVFTLADVSLDAAEALRSELRAIPGVTSVAMNIQFSRGGVRCNG
jgi:hypothetical protein